MKILIVDDSAAMRRLLVSVLREIRGAELLEAPDGAAAWKLLQEDSFRLLVTDINMPILDGLKLTGLVRGSPRHPDLPIIVVTTLSADADRRRALALGADEYLTKPLDGAELLRLARTFLDRS